VLKLRTRLACDIEFDHNSAFIVHLGNITCRTGNKLQWDSSKNEFETRHGSKALIIPEYRIPWEFPKVQASDTSKVPNA
jgi:hypothetical protein